MKEKSNINLCKSCTIGSWRFALSFFSNDCSLGQKQRRFLLFYNKISCVTGKFRFWILNPTIYFLRVILSHYHNHIALEIKKIDLTESVKQIRCTFTFFTLDELQIRHLIYKIAVLHQVLDTWHYWHRKNGWGHLNLGLARIIVSVCFNLNWFQFRQILILKRICFCDDAMS